MSSGREGLETRAADRALGHLAWRLRLARPLVPLFALIAPVFGDRVPERETFRSEPALDAPTVVGVSCRRTPSEERA